jgi:hypothetical protein
VVLPNLGSKKLGIIVSFLFFFFSLGGFAVGLCVSAKQTEDFFGTYEEKKILCFIFSWVFVFLQLVKFFYSLYFLTQEIRILVHIFLGGLRVAHPVFAKQTQELFGSKKEIGILVSLLLGFLCLFFSFSKRKKSGFLAGKK